MINPELIIREMLLDQFGSLPGSVGFLSDIDTKEMRLDVSDGFLFEGDGDTINSQNKFHLRSYSFAGRGIDYGTQRPTEDNDTGAFVSTDIR